MLGNAPSFNACWMQTSSLCVTLKGMFMNQQPREPAEGWLVGFRPRLLPEPRIPVHAAHGAAARDGRDGRQVQSLELGSDAADCQHGAHADLERAYAAAAAAAEAGAEAEAAGGGAGATAPPPAAVAPAADDDIDDGDDDLPPGCGCVGEALALERPARLRAQLGAQLVEDETNDGRCGGAPY